MERRLLPERLARTVCEIDPNPRSPFAVAVVLEVLGYSDQRAKETGWGDVFALARAVFDRIEFLGAPTTYGTGPDEDQPARAEAPSPLLSVVAQQAVWLVMVVLLIAWGRSVWSADHVPSGIAQALAAGILASLIVSGGFQYAITRRFIFHTAQRDFRQAQAFLHRALWASGLIMVAGALAVAAGTRMMEPRDRIAPLVAAGYFFLHGNYRVAAVPLIALNDVLGIVLSTGIGVGLLALTYTRLLHAGTDATMAIVIAQLVALAALWLGSLARSRSLLGGVRVGEVQDLALAAPRGSRDRAPARWVVLCLDAAPWFATGVGLGLLALTFTRLLHAGTDATMAIAIAQLVTLAALWLGSLARSRSLLGGVRVGGMQDLALAAPRGSGDRAQARGIVLCLDAAPWFATGLLYYLFLFGTRPIAWMLPSAERLVYESGVDLGLLGIVPIAIAASWGLHRYHRELRRRLKQASVLDVAALRTWAAAHFSQILWRCRLFGAATAIGLLAATAGAPWGTMSPQAFLVFRVTAVGLAIALPGFLFAFGLLTSLGALWDAGGVLVCGLILQVGEGLCLAQRGTAGWLALALVGSAATLSALAVWRAKRIVRNIDQHYYAAF